MRHWLSPRSSRPASRTPLDLIESITPTPDEQSALIEASIARERFAQRWDALCDFARGMRKLVALLVWGLVLPATALFGSSEIAWKAALQRACRIAPAIVPCSVILDKALSDRSLDEHTALGSDFGGGDRRRPDEVKGGERVARRGTGGT